MTFSSPDTQIPDSAAPARQLRPDRRIPALDGLRAFASLAVLLYHFGPHIAGQQGPFSWLHRTPGFLWEGVDLFFVLSGYLIGGILLDSRNSQRYFRTFYIRRCFRIFPLYYLTFAVYLVALAVLGPRTAHLGRLFENSISPLWYGLYLQNFAMAAAGTFGPIWLAGTWSLAVEEQFYFTLPVVIRHFSARVVFWFASAAVLGSLILRAVAAKNHLGLAGYVLLPARADALGIGVLIAWLLRFRPDLAAGKEKQIERGALALMLAWTIYGLVPTPWSIRLQFADHTGNAIVFGGVLLAILLRPDAILARFLSLAWLRTLGLMAYSTYLFHPIALAAVFQALTHHDPQLNTVADLGPLALALVLTLALSWASWNLFERKLIAIGHRARY